MKIDLSGAPMSPTSIYYRLIGIHVVVFDQFYQSKMVYKVQMVKCCVKNTSVCAVGRGSVGRWRGWVQTRIPFGILLSHIPQIILGLLHFTSHLKSL